MRHAKLQHQQEFSRVMHVIFQMIAFGFVFIGEYAAGALAVSSSPVNVIASTYMHMQYESLYDPYLINSSNLVVYFYLLQIY